MGKDYSNGRNSTSSSSTSRQRPSTSSAVPPEKGMPASAQAGIPSAAQAQIEAIRLEMLTRMDAPENERKAFLRDLQRRWHPDKNPDDTVVATAVFQYISSNSHWLL